MKKCIECNRPLISKASQLSGIGPICAKKKGHTLSVHSKINELNQVSMFARARYDVKRVDNIIILFDLHGPKTLTNDMDRVISDLFLEHSDIKDCTVIYQDSEGRFDRITIGKISRDDCEIGFFPLTPGKVITDYETALDAAKRL